jgi:chromosome segregation ATPase
MFQRGAHEVRFAVAFGGYSRQAVDTVVEQCELSISETRAHRERTEAALAEADRRVQALEARVSELGHSGAGGSWVTELVDELLDKLRQTGRELQNKVLSQAHADKERHKQVATMEPTDGARARADAILTKARRERDELDRLVEESSRQIVELLQVGRTMAEERARATWEKAQGSLREPVSKVLHLHEQRRTILKEVVELQELVEASWGRVITG